MTKGIFMKGEKMAFLGNKNPSEILQVILNNQSIYKKEYAYIILGRSGATGKSTLWSELKSHGYNAYEISEDIAGTVSYNSGNYVKVNVFQKTVVIVLNRSIERRKNGTSQNIIR